LRVGACTYEQHRVCVKVCSSTIAVVRLGCPWLVTRVTCSKVKERLAGCFVELVSVIGQYTRGFLGYGRQLEIASAVYSYGTPVVQCTRRTGFARSHTPTWDHFRVRHYCYNSTSIGSFVCRCASIESVATKAVLCGGWTRLTPWSPARGLLPTRPMGPCTDSRGRFCVQSYIGTAWGHGCFT
jgi:hypothetical protein